MQHLLIFFLAFVSSTHALIFSWSDTATGASGRSCPGSLAAAIFTGEFNRLNECTEQELWDIYASGNCCIDFMAECNYVERAWWLKTDVLKHDPLCSPMLRNQRHIGHERRRRFMARVIRRNRDHLSPVVFLK